MANDWVGQTGAVWNQDNDALLIDSLGTNTLTNNNTVTLNISDYKQGDASANYAGGATDQKLSILDASLNSGFPMKSGESNLDFTFMTWVKFSSLVDSANIVSKWGAGNSFRVYIEGGKAKFAGGGNNSGHSVSLSFDTAFTTSIWYHLAVTIVASTGAYRIRIWDDNAGALLDSDKTGNIAASYMAASPAALNLGSYDTATTDSHFLNGQLDESVMLSGILSIEDIDKVRDGMFGVPTGKISGTTNEPSTVIVFNGISWITETTISGVNGSFETDSLLLGKKLIVAVGDSGEAVAFGDVNPIEEE